MSYYPLLVTGFILIVSAGAGSLVAGIIHKRSCTQERKGNDVLSGLVFQQIGTLYAVLIAFVVYTVWGHYDSSSKATQLEAAALTDVARIALALPEPARSGIRDRVERYTRRVIDDEWLNMSKLQEALSATQAYRDLWDYVIDLQVTDPQQLVEYEYCVNHLGKVRDLRMERIAHLSLSVPWYTWSVLILLDACLVMLACFLPCASRRSHVWHVAVLSASIALLMTLIADLDNPWHGPMQISPAPYEQGLRYWKH